MLEFKSEVLNSEFIQGFDLSLNPPLSKLDSVLIGQMSQSVVGSTVV